MVPHICLDASACKLRTSDVKKPTPSKHAALGLGPLHLPDLLILHSEV